MSGRDRLQASKLRAELTPRCIGCEIIVLEEATSTNDVVAEMASGDWPEGLVVFAETQTAGRGQRGNLWASAASKGLWLSILLRPNLSLADSARLSAWAAQTIASTIGNICALEARVKLPNDVYIGDGKVAGVLVEMRAQPAAPHLAVVGLGLNVNQTLLDFPAELQKRATSLALLQRGPVDRHRLAIELLQTLDRTYGELFR
jgi:BirA family biotin operon repressor/biotin-[acetyl-CoA-carboxylase] ligase